MPDSTSGAISARVLTYLKRDPRQVMIFAMPVLFIIIFAFQAHGIHAIVWQSMIWCGWFMSIVESNGLAYDGRGFTMEVIAWCAWFGPIGSAECESMSASWSSTWHCCM